MSSWFCSSTPPTTPPASVRSPARAQTKRTYEEYAREAGIAAPPVAPAPIRVCDHCAAAPLRPLSPP